MPLLLTRFEVGFISCKVVRGFLRQKVEKELQYLDLPKKVTREMMTMIDSISNRDKKRGEEMLTIVQ
ncbi:hypothetical protein EYC80_000995 [Monilinia laxa]|uniref:Uncharacterized protein n=1 Tax=Monilinia laxa TaxID=61186 RepID=A0A5N6K7R2_MONLA|nr:hypothetical protein EYC80_000995 [Monilinia laxa]